MVSLNIPPAETFGQRCLRTMNEKRGLTGKLAPEEAAKIIDELYTDARRRPKKGEGMKAPRPRNALVDGLMVACNEDPFNATQSALRAAATGMAEIKAVSPDVTPDELLRRAKLYKQKHPLWTLTPKALAKWWGESQPPKAANQPKDPYVAPSDWQALARRVWGDVELPDNWSDISVMNRADLLKRA